MKRFFPSSLLFTVLLAAVSCSPKPAPGAFTSHEFVLAGGDVRTRCEEGSCIVSFKNRVVFKASTWSPAADFFSPVKGVLADSGLRLYRSYHGDGCPVMHGLVLFASEGRAARTNRDFGNRGDIRDIAVTDGGRTLVFQFEPHPAFKDKARETFRVRISNLEKRLARPRE